MAFLQSPLSLDTYLAQTSALDALDCDFDGSYTFSVEMTISVRFFCLRIYCECSFAVYAGFLVACVLEIRHRKSVFLVCKCRCLQIRLTSILLTVETTEIKIPNTTRKTSIESAYCKFVIPVFGITARTTEIKFFNFRSDCNSAHLLPYRLNVNPCTPVYCPPSERF